MPLYYFDIDDGPHTEDKLGVELPSLAAARREATILAGELLRDRPDAFWEVQSWTMTVMDEDGVVLFTIGVDGALSPAAAQHLRLV